MSTANDAAFAPGSARRTPGPGPTAASAASNRRRDGRGRRPPGQQLATAWLRRAPPSRRSASRRARHPDHHAAAGRSGRRPRRRTGRGAAPGRATPQHGGHPGGAAGHPKHAQRQHDRRALGAGHDQHAPTAMQAGADRDREGARAGLKLDIALQTSPSSATSAGKWVTITRQGALRRMKSTVCAEECLLAQAAGQAALVRRPHHDQLGAVLDRRVDDQPPRAARPRDDRRVLDAVLAASDAASACTSSTSRSRSGLGLSIGSRTGHVEGAHADHDRAAIDRQPAGRRHRLLGDRVEPLERDDDRRVGDLGHVSGAAASPTSTALDHRQARPRPARPRR